MATTREIIQGDISDIFQVGLVDNSAMDANYACSVTVQGSSISRAVTDKTGDNKKFIVQLTSAETAALRAGTYTMAIKITNSTLTPPFSRETHIRLDVKENIA